MGIFLGRLAFEGAKQIAIAVAIAGAGCLAAMGVAGASKATVDGIKASAAKAKAEATQKADTTKKAETEKKAA